MKQSRYGKTVAVYIRRKPSMRPHTLALTDITARGQRSTARAKSGTQSKNASKLRPMEQQRLAYIILLELLSTHY
eukprot:1900556-Amphidinium_carterae.1